MVTLSTFRLGLTDRDVESVATALHIVCQIDDDRKYWYRKT